MIVFWTLPFAWAVLPYNNNLRAWKDRVDKRCLILGKEVVSRSSLGYVWINPVYSCPVWKFRFEFPPRAPVFPSV
jgi:hypothetical protein